MIVLTDQATAFILVVLEGNVCAWVLPLTDGLKVWEGNLAGECACTDFAEYLSDVHVYIHTYIYIYIYVY